MFVFGTASSSSASTPLRLRLFGVWVEVPWSGLLGVAIIAFLWAPTFGAGASALPTAVVFAIGLYISIFLHEVAHAVTARLIGHDVDRIVLWVLGGYTSYRRNENPRAWQEGLIAAAGPLSSALIGVAALVFAAGLPATAGDIAYALGFANLLLAAYNSLPGLPLDGGGVLKSVIWASTGRERTGTLVAAWAGRIVAVAVVAIPAILALRAGRSPSLTSLIFGLLIGGYLLAGANAALRQLTFEDATDRLAVDALAIPALAVPLGLSLAEANDLGTRAGVSRLIGVDNAGLPIGVDIPAARAAVPPERVASMRVADVSTRLGSTLLVSRTEAGSALVSRLASAPAAEWVVVDESGRPCGVLRLADVEARLSNSQA